PPQAGNGPQTPDGGFRYRARSGTPTHSMSIAGTGSLFLARQILHPDAPARLGQAEPVEPEPPKEETLEQRQKRLGIRWGVLEPLPIEEPEEEPEEPPQPVRPAPRVRTPLLRIDQSLVGGLGWVTRNYTIEPTGWPRYYLYGMERM